MRPKYGLMGYRAAPLRSFRSCTKHNDLRKMDIQLIKGTGNGGK
jgi:hypothetical protein